MAILDTNKVTEISAVESQLDTAYEQLCKYVEDADGWIGTDAAMFIRIGAAMAVARMQLRHMDTFAASVPTRHRDKSTANM